MSTLLLTEATVFLYAIGCSSGHATVYQSMFTTLWSVNVDYKDKGPKRAAGFLTRSAAIRFAARHAQTIEVTS